MIVVDASVAVKWFLPEPHAEAASQLLAPDHDLVAPDLIRLEAASVFLRTLRRGELGRADAEAAMRALGQAMAIVETGPFVDRAFAIAERHGGAVYDAVYVALARSLDAALVTDDAGLADVARRAGVDAALIADGPPPDPVK